MIILGFDDTSLAWLNRSQADCPERGADVANRQDIPDSQAC